MAGIIYYGGFFRLCQVINNKSGRRLTILAYHRVTKKRIEDIRASLPSLFVTERSFIRQLEFITRSYTIITFSDLRSYARSEDIPPNALIITFDDGYEDNYQNAYPVIRAFQVPAVMFLTVNKVGGYDDASYWWDRVYSYLLHQEQWYIKGIHPELDQKISDLLREFENSPSRLFSKLDKEDTRTIDRLMDSFQSVYNISDEMINSENTLLRWEQIRKMTEVEFGSHSCNHHNLATLDNNSLVEEVTESLKEIRFNTGREVHVFSYPGGNYDERVRKVVAEAGYDFAVTTEVGVNDLTDKFALKRISVWEGTSRGMNGKFSKSLFAFNLIANCFLMPARNNG